MKTITVTLLALLATGSASIDAHPPFSRAAQQTAQATDLDDDPPFDLVLLLRESQADGQSFFYSGRTLMTYRNLLTGASETNIMISANASEVRVAHGIKKWFDGWGRVHTVSILKRQLAYNSLLSSKGVARPQATPEIPAGGFTEEDIYQVRVTGILDRATLKIPWNLFRMRNKILLQKMSSAADDYRRATGIIFDDRHRPPTLQKWYDLEDFAYKAINRCRDAIMAIPLQKVNTEGEHSRYSGYFSGDLADDTAEKTVQQLKQRPAFRHYFESHELYGLPNLDLPLDDMSKPPPLDMYSAEYRDYMDRSKYIAKLREEFKPIPLGYGWPHPDEDYVWDYADPTKLSLDSLRELDNLEKRADEALTEAEAYETVVKEWIDRKRTVGPAK